MSGWLSMSMASQWAVVRFIAESMDSLWREILDAVSPLLWWLYGQSGGMVRAMSMGGCGG